MRSHRRALRFVVAAAVILAVGGCERNLPATSQELASDLDGYMKELKRWEPLEKKVFQALSDVERTYYVDDDFVIRRFKTALPDVDEHVRELGAFEPRTPDLRVVHQRYREGWEDLGTGFKAVIAAMETKDYGSLAGAKNQLEAARRKILDAFNELDSMLVEVEPELKKLRSSEPA